MSRTFIVELRVQVEVKANSPSHAETLALNHSDTYLRGPITAASARALRELTTGAHDD